ncbi:MAG TPA: multicopper oxidase domain-containing protein [Solirubrobacterales bacterium]|nr:multicopper oxidase domain-containing protein [Solirubrobacterales bacterium]HZK15916.1 multicopper oxidase domain-containing protein [Solirubrobacterales bacterium]
MSDQGITRRKLLGAAATVPAAVGLKGLLAGSGYPEAAAGSAAANGNAPATPGYGDGAHGGFLHAAFARGRAVDHRANGFHPTELLRDFDYGKTRRLASGRVLREWEIVAVDKEIEVAPGVKYEAWTYNGQVPGPTLRAREGDRLRIRFVNSSAHPHTIHFHGIHKALMDGMPGVGESRGGGLIEPGAEFTYEFDAEPFGLHLYHCHVSPLATHIARGLYGAFIIDPKKGRPEADEMVMVLNGFDTNFDLSNELYAVNSIGFHYANEPIQVGRDELLRIYLVNALEFDPINSFHVHANFFQHYPTGTSLEPSEFTDTITQGQGQRAVLEMKFPFNGDYMFHAHINEFTELGWMGFFRVGDPSKVSREEAEGAYSHIHGVQA